VYRGPTHHRPLSWSLLDLCPSLARSDHRQMTRLAAGLLTINGTLIAQLLIFLATLGLLYWLAWGRLVGILEARQKRIQEGISAAEAAKREREAAEQEYQLRMEQARREGQVLLDRVAKQGEELRRELEDK